MTAHNPTTVCASRSTASLVLPSIGGQREAFSFGGDGMAIEPTTQQITRFAVSGLGTDEDATLEETSEFVVTRVNVWGRRVSVWGYQWSWGWTTFGTRTCERECQEETVDWCAAPDHDLGDFDWWWTARFYVARQVGVDRTVLAAGWRLVVDGTEIIGEE